MDQHLLQPSPRRTKTWSRLENGAWSKKWACSANLEKGFDFIYRSELDSGLVEHEFDHVLFGISDVTPTPNPDEVEGYRYVNFADLRSEISANPEAFTTWFKICFERAADHLKK